MDLGLQCTASAGDHDRRGQAWARHLLEAAAMKKSTVAGGWEQSRLRTGGRAVHVAASVFGPGLGPSLPRIVVEGRRRIVVED